MAPHASPSTLLAQLRLLAADPGSYFDDGAQRREFQALARQAARAVEEPRESMHRLVYGPLPLVTARIGLDRGVFAAVAGSPGGVVVEEVVVKSGLAEDGLRCVLGYLCAQGMLEESQEGVYKATAMTHMLLTPLFGDAVTHFHDTCLPALSVLNKVLGDPGDGQTAFKAGHHTNQDFDTWLASHPIQQTAFHHLTTSESRTWLSSPSLAHDLPPPPSPPSPLLILIATPPPLLFTPPGLTILQAPPALLALTPPTPGIEPMPHDLLAPQPVHGARAYYFGHVLRRYDDDAAIHILQMQLPALQAAHSRVYIDERVLVDGNGEGNGGEDAAARSVVGWAVWGARERGERRWRWLLDQAGMEVLEIRRLGGMDDAVIVARRRAQDMWR
ncbi:hypothetical protein EJ07DRAFT_185140 [Lizonia empirigonia]|nr:hypothetical protein EJ07DRAFT_185140 [Lizonia empirigonia]